MRRSRRRISPSFEAALESWREARDAFELARQADYDRALEATSGTLLNARGKACGIDSYSLFIGPDTRARAYASEELIEHWRRYPRVTFERFELAYAAGREYAS